MLNFSLIIPISNSPIDVERQMLSIINYKYYPNEVIIIDTSKNRIKYNFQKYSIKLNLKLFHLPGAYPGTARNFAVKQSTNPIVAFTDMNTLNGKFWSKKVYESLVKNNFDFLMGKRIFNAETYFQKIIRINSSGRKIVKTISGSILKKKIFNIIEFPDTRSGEDLYFIDRLTNIKYVKIGECSDLASQKYHGLPKNLKSAIKKWFLYNLFASKLNVKKTQESSYAIFFFIFFFTIFVNWNNFVANWNENNFWFIPHITKVYLLSSFFLYFLFRGIFTIITSRERLKFIIINYPIIFLVTFLLDLSKSPGLVFGQLARILNFFKIKNVKKK